MLHSYFKELYQRTMRESYNMAFKEIAVALKNGGACLDCGASDGSSFEKINKCFVALEKTRYHGLEWDIDAVNRARNKGLNIVQGDLNRELPFADEQFQCIFGLSVLEHLLNGCSFIRESYRVLASGGTLILLTPNISTFFTIALLLVGKMPSSGPHPDSNALLVDEEVFKVSSENLFYDSEAERPVHRHLVVFSYRVLKKYLSMIGFCEVRGRGFGLYPFPMFMQPILEKVDPYHCHQMVFVARK